MDVNVNIDGGHNLHAPPLTERSQWPLIAAGEGKTCYFLKCVIMGRFPKLQWVASMYVCIGNTNWTQCVTRKKI